MSINNLEFVKLTPLTQLKQLNYLALCFTQHLFKYNSKLGGHNNTNTNIKNNDSVSCTLDLEPSFVVVFSWIALYCNLNVYFCTPQTHTCMRQSTSNDHRLVVSWGKLPDRLGKTKCAVRVNWERQAEAPVHNVLKPELRIKFSCIQEGVGDMEVGHVQWSGGCFEIWPDGCCGGNPTAAVKEPVKLKIEAFWAHLAMSPESEDSNPTIFMTTEQLHQLQKCHKMRFKVLETSAASEITPLFSHECVGA